MLLDEISVGMPEATGPGFQLFRPGCLLRYADYVAEDWIDLVGLDASRTDVLVASESLSRGFIAGSDAYYDAIERHSPLCLFKRRRRLVGDLRGRRRPLQRTRANASSNSGLRIDACELRQRDERLWPTGVGVDRRGIGARQVVRGACFFPSPLSARPIAPTLYRLMNRRLPECLC